MKQESTSKEKVGPSMQPQALTGNSDSNSIPSGQYQLLVDANHDKIQYASPINIAGPSATVVITLSARKSLSVTSAADQRPATGGEELSSQTVSVLPLNKRDFSQLLLLAAGTMTDANGATNFTQQFAINGQRGVEAVFAMDGADITDPEMGGSTFSNFNVDAVRGDSVEFWLDARRDRQRRSGFHQHRHPLR